MLADQCECACGERFTRLCAWPGGRARGMREWDYIDAQLAARHDLERTDLFDEWTRRQELFDRDATHWQNQRGFEQLDFAIEPGTAIEQLFRTRHTVATLGVFAGE